MGTTFRETSARLATNIDTLFEEITEKILNDQQFKSDKTLKSSTNGINNEPERN